MTADAKSRESLPACCGQPLGRRAQQRWFERQLLVEFALHGQPERRVVLLLRYGLLRRGQRQPLLRSICPSGAFCASELTFVPLQAKHASFRNSKAERLRSKLPSPARLFLSARGDSTNQALKHCGTTYCKQYCGLK